jgi:exoribonuclease-2
MQQSSINSNSLVLYKQRPARVIHSANKLLLELENHHSNSVRLKDVTLLHPGPLHSLDDLIPQIGELEPAWEILIDITSNEEKGLPLSDLAELVYGDYTPSSAWAAWQLLDDGLYFHGNPESIFANSPQQVENILAARNIKAEEKQEWDAFIKRLAADQIDLQTDTRFLREVEDLAFGRRKDSRVLL